MTHSQPPSRLTNTPLDFFLGRYERVRGTHRVFWECLYETGTGYKSLFRIRWGRQNSQNIQTLALDYDQAHRQCQRRRAHGYILQNESYKTLAEAEKNALNAVLTPMEEKKDLAKRQRRMM